MDIEPNTVTRAGAAPLVKACRTNNGCGRAVDIAGARARLCRANTFLLRLRDNLLHFPVVIRRRSEKNLLCDIREVTVDPRCDIDEYRLSVA